MSKYTPRYEWEHGSFTTPRQVCALCGTDTGQMRRLFWAGTYMNGDDEYMLDVCVAHFKSHGQRIVQELEKGKKVEEVIVLFKVDNSGLPM